MTRLGQAVALAAEVHQDQVDKAHAPYILHAIAVMQAVAPDEDAMIVGVLHDAFEDALPSNRLTVEYLVKRNLGAEIHEAVLALTHDAPESYDEYIERVAQNYLARKVKIADLTHNMDPRRIPAGEIVDKDFARWEKYRRALVRLQRVY